MRTLYAARLRAFCRLLQSFRAAPRDVLTIHERPSTPTIRVVVAMLMSGDYSVETVQRYAFEAAQRYCGMRDEDIAAC